VVLPRGRALFDHLANELSERVVQGCTLPVRILSIRAARARKPYSLAIALHGRRVPVSGFRIHAGDLARATSTGQRRDGSPLLVPRKPDRTPGRTRSRGRANVWELSPEIRESVQFRCADISRENALAEESPTI